MHSTELHQSTPACSLLLHPMLLSAHSGQLRGVSFEYQTNIHILTETRSIWGTFCLYTLSSYEWLHFWMTDRQTDRQTSMNVNCDDIWLLLLLLWLSDKGGAAVRPVRLEQTSTVCYQAGGQCQHSPLGYSQTSCWPCQKTDWKTPDLLPFDQIPSLEVISRVLSTSCW